MTNYQVLIKWNTINDLIIAQFETFDDLLYWLKFSSSILEIYREIKIIKNTHKT